MASKSNPKVVTVPSDDYTDENSECWNNVSVFRFIGTICALTSLPWGGGGGLLHSQLCFLFVSFSFSAMTPETGSDFKT